MENFHRNIFRKSRVYLVKNLTSLDEILDYLESNQIISENQRHNILSSNTPADKIRNFLDTIVRCGPKAYNCFKLALNETNQMDTYEYISSFENEPSGDTTSRDVKHDSSATPNKATFSPDKGNDYPLSPYVVTSSPHGYVLIINIETYSSTSGVSSRSGSSRDADQLQTLFEDLHYSVAVVKNLKSNELKSTVSEFASKTEHKEVHAAGLIILAHGLEHHIIASDGIHVSIDQLVNCFTNKNCPHLVGKPKLVIIQACRGEERRHNGLDRSDAAQYFNPSSTNISLDPSSWLSLPHMSDCIIVYSTLPGFVSWRSETDGSWYIRVLVDVFRLHAHRLHILDLLTEVNNRLVSEAPSLGIVQISQPVTTLTKPFYLSTLT